MSYFNFWNIWGFLITAAVITLLVLVIVYMNKTTTVENKTTDIINNYNPPDTYVGATSLEPESQNINLDTNTFPQPGPFIIGVPAIKFVVDKNWKPNTKALITGSIKYDPSEFIFPTGTYTETFILTSNFYLSENTTVQFSQSTVPIVIDDVVLNVILYFVLPVHCAIVKPFIGGIN